MFSRAQLANMSEERREKEAELVALKAEGAALRAEMGSSLREVVKKLRLSESWLLFQLGKPVVKQEEDSTTDGSLESCIALLEEVQTLQKGVQTLQEELASRKEAGGGNPGSTRGPQQPLSQPAEEDAVHRARATTRDSREAEAATDQEAPAANNPPPREADTKEVEALKAKHQADMKALIEKLEPQRDWLLLRLGHQVPKKEPTGGDNVEPSMQQCTDVGSEVQRLKDALDEREKREGQDDAGEVQQRPRREAAGRVGGSG